MLAAVAMAFVPRLLEGRAALQWTRFHAARAGPGRAADHARLAARAAVVAVERLAPLPGGAAAAREALGVARRMEPQDGEIALFVASEVRAGLERVRLSRLRGLGLGGLADEARRLEDALREASRE